MASPVSFLRMSALTLLLGALLSACVVEQVPGPGPGPFQQERPEFCAQEYAPVCARRGRERRSFANACRAESAGFRVLGDGECGSSAGGGGIGGPRFCTREYRPVCARRGGSQRTFSNSCEAENSGFRIISDGECRSNGGGGGGFDQPGFCTREYAPVCARRAGSQRTFSNSCEAENAGFRVFSGGECRSQGAGGGYEQSRSCTREYAPVCARRGRNMRTFGNNCEADLAGFRVIAGGPC